MIAMKAVEHSAIMLTYGVLEEGCSLLNARGNIPSMDIAKVSLEVAIVPDSSTPRIEAKAPNVRMNLPNNGERR